MTISKLGAFIIYANGEFEAECRTLSGAKRCVAKLRRLGFSPRVARHAWLADGSTCNVDCGTKALKVRPFATPTPVEPHAPVTQVEPNLRPAYVEVRRECWPDGSGTALPFAVRVF